MEPLLVTSSALLGREFLVQTVTKTTSNIYSSIESIMSSDDLYFKNFLEKTDINIKLNIIHKVIDDLNNSNFTYEKLKDSIDLTLKYLSDILKKIEKEIDSINLEIDNHKKKWLNKFRTPSYDSMITNLGLHLNILDKRFNLLMDLLKIN